MLRGVGSLVAQVVSPVVLWFVCACGVRGDRKVFAGFQGLDGGVGVGGGGA